MKKTIFEELGGTCNGCCNSRRVGRPLDLRRIERVAQGLREVGNRLDNPVLVADREVAELGAEPGNGGRRIFEGRHPGFGMFGLEVRIATGEG